MIGDRIGAEARDIDRLAPVRPYLDGAEAGRRLTRHLPCLRDGFRQLVDVRPERLDVRGEDAVELTCSVRMRDPVSSLVETRPVLVASSRDAMLRAAELPAVHTPLGRIDTFAGADPETGVSLWMSPADPRLRAVPALLVRAASEAGSRSVRVLGHRFGKRASFLLARPSDAGPAGARVGLVLKLYSGDAHTRVAGLLDELQRAELGFRTPEVLVHDSALRAVLLEWIPGEPGHERLASGGAFPARELGRAVRRYQELPAGMLPVHDAAAEYAVVRRLATRAAVLHPGLDSELDARTQELAWQAGETGGSARVLAHRDLHDKQVVCAGPTIGVIDWDLASRAPAPLDPANFLAHLRLRALQGCISAGRADEEREAFLEGYRDGHSAPSPEALQTWEALVLARLVAVYALRPAWNGLGRELLARLPARKETS